MPVDDKFKADLDTVESGGNPNAVSPKGALGISQVMPATGREMGFTPGQLRTVKGSHAARDKYLDKLKKQFGDNETVVAGAYNGGPERMKKFLAGKGDLSNETIDYIGKMTALRTGMGPHSRPNPDAIQNYLDELGPKAQAERDAASYTHRAGQAAKAVGDWVAYSALPSAKGLATGMVMGLPPVAGYEAYKTNQMSPGATGLLHGVGRAMGSTPGKMDEAINEMDPAAKGLMSAAVSGAEFEIAGKVGHAVSGVFSRALVRAGLATKATEAAGVQIGSMLGAAENTAESNIVATGQTAATSLARKQLAGRLAGGMVGGIGAQEAFLGLQSVEQGKLPSAKDVISNAGLGMLFGAVGGAYSPETNAKIGKFLPQIQSTMDADTKASFEAANKLAPLLDKDNPHAGAALVTKLASGKGSDIDRQLFQAKITEHPELANNKFMANMININRDYATPEVIHNTDVKDGNVRITYENANRESITTEAGPRQQDRFDRLAQQGQIYIKRVEGSPDATKRYVGAVAGNFKAIDIPDETKVNDILNRLENGSYVDGAFGGKRGIIPKPNYQYNQGPENPPPPEAIKPFPPSHPQTPGLIPSGPVKDIPVPNFQLVGGPRQAITPGLIKDYKPTPPPPPFERFESDSGPFMWSAPETLAGTPIAAPGIEAVLPPLADPKTSVPAAPQFSNPITIGPGDDFNREPNTGDIVRSVPHDDGTSTIVDKRGNTAVVDNKDIPHPKPEIIRGDPVETSVIKDPKTGKTYGLSSTLRNLKDFKPETIDKALTRRLAFESERLKKLENDLGSNDEPPSTSPKPGRPIAEQEDEDEYYRVRVMAKKLGVSEDAARRIRAVNRGEIGPRGEGIPRRPFKPSERGSLSGKKILTEMKNPIVTKAAQLSGAKVYKEGLPTDPGFVVEKDGVRVRYDTLREVFDHLKTGVTMDRMAAEQNQVIDSGHIKLPIPTDLSPRIKLARVGGNAEEFMPHTKESAIGGFLELGQKIADRFENLSYNGRTGLANLMRMGPPGREGAKLATIFSGTKEMMDREDGVTYDAFKQVRDKYKFNSVRDLENGKAPQEVMDFYDKVVRPKTFDRQYNDAKLLGSHVADPMVGNRYVPHLLTIQPVDLEAKIIKEFKDQGIEVKNKADAARILNDPDAALSAKEQQLPQKDMLKRLQQLEWAKEKSANIAKTLTKERKNSNLYSDNLDTTLRMVGRSRNAMNAEAAVFGPKLERINDLASRIDGNPPFPTNNTIGFLKIMNDVRGKVHIPISDAQIVGMDFARGMSVLSAPKHLTQLLGMWNDPRFANAVSLRGPYEMVKTLGGMIAQTDTNTRMALVSALDRTRMEMTDGEKWTMQKADQADVNKAYKALKITSKVAGEVGQIGIHTFLNVGRRNFARMGAAAFDNLVPKFLKGDPTATAMFHDILQFKLTPDEFRSMDPEVVKDMVMKNAADLGGFTFRPQDMPVFARSTIGRAFLQLHSYAWQLVKQFNNLFNNTNLPASTRAAAVAKLFVEIPLAMTLTSKLYKMIGNDTISSTAVLQAYDEMRKGDHPIADTLNWMVQGWINSHVMGQLSTLIEGMDRGNVEIATRDIRMQPAMLGMGINALYAGTRTAQAVESHSPKDWDAAYRAYFNMLPLGGLATALGRRFTNPAGFSQPATKPIRLGKKSIIHGALRKID